MFKRDRNHNSQIGRKHSRRGKSPGSAILSVERLELREMLAGEPILEIPANQFFGEGVSGPQAIPFFATFTDQVTGDDDFTCMIDWGDPNDPGAETATVQYSIDGTSIIGRIEAFHTYTVADTYTVTVTLTDGQGNTALAPDNQTTVDVFPEDETLFIGVGGDPDIGEGEPYFLILPTDAYAVISSWTINWGDGQIETFVPNDPSIQHDYTENVLVATEYRITAAAVTDDGTKYSLGTSVEVEPVGASNPSISGFATVDANAPYTIMLTPPGDVAVAAWTIFWEWDGTETGASSVLIGTETSATHFYSEPGEYQVLARALKIDTTSADSNIIELTVFAAGPGVELEGGVLSVTGDNTASDGVTISQSAGDISVTAGFTGNVPVVFSADDVDEIRVQGGGGNDIILASPGITKPMKIEGGEGNDLITSGGGDDLIEGGPGIDIIYGAGGDDVILGGIGNDDLLGGGGNDVLIGGDGVDMLFGQAGRDLLIGSADEDLLSAGDGEDILIGGSTVYDGYDDINSTAAIDAIMDIWTGTGNFTARKNALLASPALQFNAVFDDDATDIILGGGGRDLVFGNSSAGGGVVDLLALLGDDLVEVN
jgi:Ca2+-binding RTX toxin-like protein